MECCYENESDSGLTRVSQDSEGNVKIDSYYGNVKDGNDHDRFTVDTTNDGRITGHGFDHEDKFDSDKDNEKTK